MRSFWFIIGLLVLTLTAFRALLLRRRQNRQLRQLARDRRLNFTPDDLVGVHERFQNLSLIRQGHRRRAWNLLYGTTDIGFIAMFCYRFDLGFGTRQTSSQYWLAVIETPYDHPCWQAYSPDHQPRSHNQPFIELAGFTLRADSESTLEALSQTGLDVILENATPAERLESNHRMIAASAPYTRQIEIPTRLLDTVTQLARLTHPKDEDE